MSKHLNMIIILVMSIALMTVFITPTSSVIQKYRPEIFAVYVNPGTDIDVSTVKMYLDGMDVTPWATVTPSRISFTPLKPLDAGTHWVKVVINDPQRGITGEKSWSFNFSISTEDAYIEIDPLLTPTIEQLITVSGTTIGDIEVEIFVNGIHANSGFSDHSGRFSIAGVYLEEGENIITAVARDPLTDEFSREYRAQNRVFLDSTPPTINSVFPPGGASVKSPVLTVSVTYGEEFGSGVSPETIELIVDGTRVDPQQVDEYSCTYNQAEQFTPGPHRIAFSISDRLGNSCEKYQWDFQVINPDHADFPIRSMNATNPDTWDMHPESINEQPSRPDVQLLVNDPSVPEQPTPTPTPTHFQFEPPFILSPHNGALFREPEITVSGIANRNLTVQLSINNQIRYETLSDNRGNFTFMSVILDNKDNILNCRVTDNKGGFSDFSLPVHITYERLLRKKLPVYLEIKQEPEPSIPRKEKIN